MHELATSNTMKLCSRKSTHIQALRRFHLTSMKWRLLHWLAVILMCRASLGYAILPWLPCSIGGTCVGYHWYVQNAIFSWKLEHKYKLWYTVLTVSYNCSYMYIHFFDLKYACTIGRQSQFEWLCSSWHQPPKTQQIRFLQDPEPPMAPHWLCQMGLRQPSRWSIFTGQHTPPCAGCLQSWPSGLGRTCRRSWGFQIKPIRERSQALDGHLQSLTVSCKTTWSLVIWQPWAVWSGSPSFSEGWCVHAAIHWICQQNIFLALTQRYAIVHWVLMYMCVYPST